VAETPLTIVFALLKWLSEFTQPAGAPWLGSAVDDSRRHCRWKCDSQQPISRCSCPSLRQGVRHLFLSWAAVWRRFTRCRRHAPPQKKVLLGAAMKPVRTEASTPHDIAIHVPPWCSGQDGDGSRAGHSQVRRWVTASPTKTTSPSTPNSMTVQNAEGLFCRVIGFQMGWTKPSLRRSWSA